MTREKVETVSAEKWSEYRDPLIEAFENVAAWFHRCASRTKKKVRRYDAQASGGELQESLEALSFWMRRKRWRGIDRVFNLGGDEYLTLQEAVSEICESLQEHWPQIELWPEPESRVSVEVTFTKYPTKYGPEDFEKVLNDAIREANSLVRKYESPDGNARVALLSESGRMLTLEGEDFKLGATAFRFAHFVAKFASSAGLRAKQLVQQAAQAGMDEVDEQQIRRGSSQLKKKLGDARYSRFITCDSNGYKLNMGIRAKFTDEHKET